MSISRSLVIAALAVLCHPPVAAQPDGGDELTERIAQLEARVTALQQDEAAREAQARRRDAIRQLVSDVLANADRRAMTLRGGAHWSSAGSLRLASADNSFSVEISGYLQIRFVYNRQEGDDIDRHRAGFENRRLKIHTRGDVYDWAFRFTTDFERDSGIAELSDATLTREIATIDDTPLVIKFGQFKPKLIREDVVSSTRQIAVDRSLVRSGFAPGRIQGVEVSAEGEVVRGYIALSDGIDSINTPALAFDTEFAITGRVEAVLSGEWGNFRGFSRPGADDSGLVVGAAAHYESAEAGTADPGGELFLWTTDIDVHLAEWALYAAVLGGRIDDGPGDREPIGVVAQAAVQAARQVELFTRYEWGDDDTNEDDLSVLTVGGTRFFHGRNVKWISDIGYAFSPVSAFWASGGAGFRTDSTGEDGQIVARTQVLIVF